MIPHARTPERKALMLAEYATSLNGAAFFARLNALPGPPLSNELAMRTWAALLGVRKSPETISEIARVRGIQSMASRDLTQARAPFIVAAPPPPEALTPEQQAEVADSRLEARHALARKMLSRKVAPEKVREQTRLPLREVLRLAGEARMGIAP